MRFNKSILIGIFVCFLLIYSLFIVTIPIDGQITSHTSYNIRSGTLAQRPSLCVAGSKIVDIYIATDTDLLYICTATNTWGGGISAGANVTGAASSVIGTIPTFTDTTGKIFSSSIYKPIFDDLGVTANIFANPTYPNAYAISGGLGNVDLYTVPAGRKAIVIDIMVTNSTVSTITYYTQVKIGGTYFRTCNATTESAAGIGHNYAIGGTRNCSQMVMNAGEIFGINTDVTGLSVWSNIIEFDSGSPISRASLTTMTAGDNTLFTVPASTTVSFGNMGTGAAPNNTPALQITSFVYRNSSGGSRTLAGAWWIPNGGSKSNANQVVGSNVVVDTSGFSKFIYGNTEPGATLVINVDANTAGQLAWVNYISR